MFSCGSPRDIFQHLNFISIFLDEENYKIFPDNSEGQKTILIILFIPMILENNRFLY